MRCLPRYPWHVEYVEEIRRMYVRHNPTRVTVAFEVHPREFRGRSRQENTHFIVSMVRHTLRLYEDGKMRRRAGY